MTWLLLGAAIMLELTAASFALRAMVLKRGTPMGVARCSG